VGSAHAAEITEIAEPVRGNSAVFHLDAGYEFHRESGRVSREAHCASPDSEGPPTPSLCDTPQIQTQREFDYETIEHQIDIEASVGLDVGLEFHLLMPIVISSQQSAEFAPGVNEDNSRIYPSEGRINQDFGDFDSEEGSFFNTYRFFSLSEDPRDYTQRRGFADPSLGFDWLVLSQERKPHLADLLLGIDYTIPIAEAKAADNSSVGEGLHKFNIQLAASRKFGIVEPFIGVDYTAPVPGGRGSLFGDADDNQRYDRPGHHIRTNFGVSFYLLDDETTQRRVELQVGGGFSYTTEGLSYNALFEPLSGSECNGLTAEEADVNLDGAPYRPNPAETTSEAARCAWVVQQPSNANPDSSGPTTYSHNGLTVEEAHLGYHIRAALFGRFHRNVGARLGFQWRAEANHFLSGASTGEDNNEDGVVNLDPSGSPLERNPNYNPTIDSVGQRFWLEGLRQLELDIALLLYF
jgi:hypothetical protein